MVLCFLFIILYSRKSGEVEHEIVKVAVQPRETNFGDSENNFYLKETLFCVMKYNSKVQNVNTITAL